MGQRVPLECDDDHDKVLLHVSHKIWQGRPNRSRIRTKSLVRLVDGRTEKDPCFYQNVYTSLRNLPLEIDNLSLA